MNYLSAIAYLVLLILIVIFIFNFLFLHSKKTLPFNEYLKQIQLHPWNFWVYFTSFKEAL